MGDYCFYLFCRGPNCDDDATRFVERSEHLVSRLGYRVGAVILSGIANANTYTELELAAINPIVHKESTTRITELGEQTNVAYVSKDRLGRTVLLELVNGRLLEEASVAWKSLLDCFGQFSGYKVKDIGDGYAVEKSENAVATVLRSIAGVPAPRSGSIREKSQKLPVQVLASQNVSKKVEWLYDIVQKRLSLSDFVIFDQSRFMGANTAIYIKRMLDEDELMKPEARVIYAVAIPLEGTPSTPADPSSQVSYEYVVIKEAGVVHAYQHFVEQHETSELALCLKNSTFTTVCIVPEEMKSRKELYHKGIMEMELWASKEEDGDERTRMDAYRSRILMVGNVDAYRKSGVIAAHRRMFPDSIKSDQKIGDMVIGAAAVDSLFASYTYLMHYISKLPPGRQFELGTLRLYSVVQRAINNGYSVDEICLLVEQVSDDPKLCKKLVNEQVVVPLANYSKVVGTRMAKKEVEKGFSGNEECNNNNITSAIVPEGDETVKDATDANTRSTSDCVNVKLHVPCSSSSGTIREEGPANTTDENITGMADFLKAMDGGKKRSGSLRGSGSLDTSLNSQSSVASSTRPVIVRQKKLVPATVMDSSTSGLDARRGNTSQGAIPFQPAKAKDVTVKSKPPKAPPVKTATRRTNLKPLAFLRMLDKEKRDHSPPAAISALKDKTLTTCSDVTPDKGVYASYTVAVANVDDSGEKKGVKRKLVSLASDDANPLQIYITDVWDDMATYYLNNRFVLVFVTSSSAAFFEGMTKRQADTFIEVLHIEEPEGRYFHAAIVSTVGPEGGAKEVYRIERGWQRLNEFVGQTEKINKGMQSAALDRYLIEVLGKKLADQPIFYKQMRALEMGRIPRKPAPPDMF